jgi:hypothetical protein
MSKHPARGRLLFKQLYSHGNPNAPYRPSFDLPMFLMGLAMVIGGAAFFLFGLYSYYRGYVKLLFFLAYPLAGLVFAVLFFILILVVGGKQSHFCLYENGMTFLSESSYMGIRRGYPVIPWGRIDAITIEEKSDEAFFSSRLRLKAVHDGGTADTISLNGLSRSKVQRIIEILKLHIPQKVEIVMSSRGPQESFDPVFSK